jgi:uncharacterized protein YndB with AHSA1/START domain
VEEQARKGELVITRVFDAPLELVWRAWTEPEHFKKWWGPRGFTTPVAKMDVRAGGKYLWCMEDTDGTQYWITGVYREVVPRKRIMNTESFADEDGNVVPASRYGMGDDWPPETLVSVNFEPAGGRTRITMRHSGLPANEMGEKSADGWNESFDRLAESLAA